MLSLQGLLQGGTQREDFVCAPQSHAPRVGGLHTTPHLAQERFAQAPFKLFDLPAQRLRGEVQLSAGPGNAALAQRGPEVEEVLLVHAKASLYSICFTSKVSLSRINECLELSCAVRPPFVSRKARHQLGTPRQCRHRGVFHAMSSLCLFFPRHHGALRY